LKARTFDIVLSCFALLSVSPIVLLAALLIKATSRGPVFYLAERVGKGGIHFKMFKLRTMYNHDSGPVISEANDSRITPVGKVLRKLKIDELPQFWNILRGDMTLVGPRPEAPSIVDQYYSDWMLETLNVAPGLTSPGAIYYYSASDSILGEGDSERQYVEYLLKPKLAIDLAYLSRSNLLSDIFVIFHTLIAIIGYIANFPIGPQRKDILNSRKWIKKS